MIFEERVRQINLQRRWEEVRARLGDLREDVGVIEGQLGEQVKRKSKLMGKIEASSEHFNAEAQDLRGELARVKKKLIDVYNHKEKVED